MMSVSERCSDDIRREVIAEVAMWLRHVDRFDEIPAARIGMPENNPLWDAANAIEAHFNGVT